MQIVVITGKDEFYGTEKYFFNLLVENKIVLLKVNNTGQLQEEPITDEATILSNKSTSDDVISIVLVNPSTLSNPNRDNKANWDNKVSMISNSDLVIVHHSEISKPSDLSKCCLYLSNLGKKYKGLSPSNVLKRSFSNLVNSISKKGDIVKESEFQEALSGLIGVNKETLAITTKILFLPAYLVSQNGDESEAKISKKDYDSLMEQETSPDGKKLQENYLSKWVEEYFHDNGFNNDYYVLKAGEKQDFCKEYKDFCDNEH